MMSLLYSDDCSEMTTRRTMEWSLSSQELPSLVYNLVRLHDCFIHTLNGPKVLFDVSQSYTRGVLTAFVNVRWQPPRVIFSDLPSRLLEGDPYRITPRLANIDLFADDNNGFSWLKDEITYTVTKSSLPLLWDDAEQCFYVPDSREVYHPLFSFYHVLRTCYLLCDQETKDGVHETILSARITTHFQGGVRFETQSRYSIKLQVHGDEHADISCEIRDGICHGISAFRLREGRPAWLDPGPKYLFPSQHSSLSAHKLSEQLSRLQSVDIDPISTTRQCTSRNAPSSDTVYRARKDSVTESLCDLPSPAAIESNARSPGKRKPSWTDESALHASEPLVSEEVQRPCTESDAKRRKLELENYEVLFTEVATDRGKTSDSDSVTSSPKRSAGAPIMSRLSIPSSLSSGSSSSPINNYSPPVTASVTSATSLPLLTQEQIQRNYREFVEQQQRKAAERAYYAANIPGFDGVVSPTDVNDKSIERIFIERMDNDEEAED
jgi:hypothetical protein